MTMTNNQDPKPVVGDKLPEAKPSVPTVTSANLPKPPEPQPVVIADKDIIAKPLVDADFTKIKPKNPAMSLYWGNRLANNGLRIEDLKSRGFRPAKPDELIMPNGKPLTSALVVNGLVQRGDLLCLIIPSVDYKGALKHNEEMARLRVSGQAAMAQGRKELADGLKEVGGLPARYKGKIQVYVPGSEIDNL